MTATALGFPLPADFQTWGYVVGRIVQAIADTSDDEDDYPEGIPATGTVRFTPLNALARTLDYPALIQLRPVECPLNELGQLITKATGKLGIWLPVGTWSVHGPDGIPDFVIDVTTAHTPDAPLDLAKVAPYTPPSDATVQVMLIPSDLPAGRALSWDGGQIVGVDPETLRGPQGIQGPVGNPTAWELRGNGMPEGVVTAPPGTYYTDNLGTAGAWRWLKTSGTGKTGWIVTVGDTGWRRLPLDAPHTGDIAIRRIGATCMLVTLSAVLAEPSNGMLLLTLPTHFAVQQIFRTVAWQGSSVRMLSISASKVNLWNFPAAGLIIMSATWLSSSSWPTELPGTPA